jgi:hypothetical protein
MLALKGRNMLALNGRNILALKGRNMLALKGRNMLALKGRNNTHPTPPSGYSHGCRHDLRGLRAGNLPERVYLNRRWQ